MDTKELSRVAKHMVMPNKGILAADESTGTITKRFDSIKVESTEDNRRDWRQLLFQTQSISNYISGIILFDETLRQSTSGGKKFVDLLNDTAESLTADVWNIFTFFKNFKDMRNMQFRLVNNTGAESDIEFGFMRLI